MTVLIPEHLQKVKPYIPGKPMEELERELGISGSVKLASNENPIGPSTLALEAIAKSTAQLHRYPDGGAHYLTAALAKKWDLESDSIVVGNGSDDHIGMICRACLLPGDEVIIPQPSFLMYELAVRWCAATPVFIPLKDLSIDLDSILDAVTAKTKIVFLCNPNNPTGSYFNHTELDLFLDRLPEGVVTVIDEAYVEFVRADDFPKSIELLRNGRSIIVLRTFSKAYGLAGLRVGYGLMSAKWANLLHRVRMPFNVSIPAQMGAIAALDDIQHLENTCRVIHQGLEWLFSELTRMGLAFYPTQANFFLIDVQQSADDLYEKMLRQGVIVRSMSAYGYSRFIRISAGLPEENQRFIKALDEVL
jgi:histidinol-phosphate aminotransferase